MAWRQRDENIDSYFRNLKSSRILSDEEERGLSRRIGSGTKTLKNIPDLILL